MPRMPHQLMMNASPRCGAASASRRRLLSQRGTKVAGYTQAKRTATATSVTQSASPASCQAL